MVVCPDLTPAPLSGKDVVESIVDGSEDITSVVACKPLVLVVVVSLIVVVSGVGLVVVSGKVMSFVEDSG